MIIIHRKHFVLRAGFMPWHWTDRYIGFRLYRFNDNGKHWTARLGFWWFELVCINWFNRD